MPGAVAPPLQHATPTQIAEAVRVGPYLMPRFAERADRPRARSTRSRATCSARATRDDRGGWGIGNIGPIPEGMVAWLLAGVAAAARRAADRGAPRHDGRSPALAVGCALARGAVASAPRPSRAPRTTPIRATRSARRRGPSCVVALLLAGARLPRRFAVVSSRRRHPAARARVGARAGAARRRAVLAGKRVVPRETAVEERPQPRRPARREREVERASRAARDGVSRRRLLGAAGVAAGTALAAAAVAPIASLGPAVGDSIVDTPWRRGRRLVDEDGEPLTADDIVEGAFLTAFPEGADKRELGSPVVVVRDDPATLRLPPARRGWAPEGILAYSKICTHAGCAVALFRYPLYEPTSDAARRSSAPATTRPSTRARAATRRSSGPAGRAAPAAAADDRPERASCVAGGGFSGRDRAVLVGARRRERSRARRPSRVVDERARRRRPLRKALRYVFPDHWSFLLGEIALYCVPRPRRHRHLPGALLRAEHAPTTSTRAVRAAARARGLHGLRVGARPLLRRPRRPADPPDPPLGGATSSSSRSSLHLLRVFFTGAFRKPRELN